MSDIASYMGDVARRLLGEPNKALSTERELRYGSRGSLSVDLDKGVWHDHEAGAGGGVLSLIERETKHPNGAAVEWMKAELGIELPDKANQITAQFDYVDEHGEVLFQVVRFEPKDFRQRRPDGCGGWDWKLGDVRRVPYRLPQLLDAGDRTIYIVEGEKDVHALERLGLVATCNPGGAGKWRADFAPYFQGADVVVLPDNDIAGEKHAADVAAKLKGTAQRVRIVPLPGLPPKGDPCDWIAAGGTLEELAKLADGAAEEAIEAEARRSKFFVASSLAGLPVPERQWSVTGFVPTSTVTLLGGDGGTGKSLIALQLGVAAATGGSWLGQPVTPGPALMLSAEDEREELHRRLAAICAAEGMGLDELDRLTLRSVAGEDALLAVLDRGSGAFEPTPLFHELDQRIGDEHPGIVILDTLADLHSGDENVRSHARQFVGMLRGLAIRHATAVLLLAHPSLTGISSGTGSSGNTAWNASVRSRLYLERVVSDGYEADPDARVLHTKKANYGRVGRQIAMRWQDGVFVADGPGAGIDRMAANAKAERVFLKLLRMFADEGRHVSASPGPTYAPAVFARHPDAEGCGKRVLMPAMEALFATRKIRIETHGPPSRPRSHVVEVRPGEGQGKAA